jgi:hypothetical protein
MRDAESSAPWLLKIFGCPQNAGHCRPARSRIPVPTSSVVKAAPTTANTKVTTVPREIRAPGAPFQLQRANAASSRAGATSRATPAGVQSCSTFETIHVFTLILKLLHMFTYIRATAKGTGPLPRTPAPGHQSRPVMTVTPRPTAAARCIAGVYRCRARDMAWATDEDMSFMVQISRPRHPSPRSPGRRRASLAAVQSRPC